jgi:catechol 2,3-dioxygenase-like lactoylglutathione lyase family enzyme
MTAVIHHITLDCAQPDKVAAFWSELTGCPLDEEASPDATEAVISLPDGPILVFVKVPEAKAVKNRMHVCLRPDSTRDLETDRLLGLGASVLDDRRRPDGKGWVVLADPEGNEFCILRSVTERAATLPAAV